MTAGVPLREGAIVTTGTDGTPVPDNAALSTDERAELQRLRAEVAELRSQAAAEPAVSDQTVVTAPPASPMAAVAFRGRATCRSTRPFPVGSRQPTRRR